MNTIVRALESLFNRINDWDGTWIGFRRLKPAQRESMSSRTVLVLSLFYAPVAAFGASGVAFLLGVDHRAIWICAVAAALGFVLLQFMSAFFWSQRASRLREAEAINQP